MRKSWKAWEETDGSKELMSSQVNENLRKQAKSLFSGYT